MKWQWELETLADGAAATGMAATGIALKVEWLLLLLLLMGGSETVVWLAQTLRVAVAAILEETIVLAGALSLSGSGSRLLRRGQLRVT